MITASDLFTPFSQKNSSFRYIRVALANAHSLEILEFMWNAGGS